MGSNGSKGNTVPEFKTHLPAQLIVGTGERIVLKCEVNTADVTATLKKNNQELNLVHGKHIFKQEETLLSLEILNADEGDGGRYTLDVKNKKGSASSSIMVIIGLKPWRVIKESQDEMLNYLRNYEICKKAPELHFLLHGPVGAGKSSIINTINSIFENRPYYLSLTAAASGKSFTLKYQKFPIGSEHSGQVPFAFYDVMGLEAGETEGMHTDDIISALKGHIPEDYEFQPHAMIKEDKRYISNPTLRDMIHCLVSVVPAATVNLMSDSVIDKMKTVRAAASALGMPQMVFMTKVDEACPMIKDDLSMVYQSKKIKEKVQECSNRLGVPMNCIFPLKNYHEETDLNEVINLMMLDALKQIVFAANDYVKKCSAKKSSQGGECSCNCFV